jgi:hypothetical protein
VVPEIRQVFLAWFTYDTERPPQDVTATLGEPGHRWLTAQGPYSGDTANLTVYVTEGGVFDSATPPATTDPAGVHACWSSPTAATASTYVIPSRLAGEIPLQRSPRTGSRCAALPQAL